MNFDRKYFKLKELLPKFPETLCLNHLITPMEIIPELIKIAKSQEIDLDITDEKISEVEIYLNEYLDELYKNNEIEYISWELIKYRLNLKPDFYKIIFNIIREGQHKISSLEDFEHNSVYINRLRKNFEVPKEIVELLYLENKKEENKIRVTDGGARCSCGAFHWAPPKSNVLVFYTKEYTKDRDLILSNNLYTSPCDKCGKPYLWESLTYIDLDKKIVVGHYQHFFEFLKNAGYKIYEVKYEPGGLEGYIKIIEELEGIKKSNPGIKEKPKNSKDKNDFKEIYFKELFRINIDNTKDLVVSETEDLFWVSELLNTESYIGFTTKGFGFKKSNLKDFIDKCNNSIISNSENEMQWANSKSSKLLINLHESRGGEPLIDIRQYINQPNFTGFTTKGIRVQIDKFQDLLAKLKTLL